MLLQPCHKGYFAFMGTQRVPFVHHPAASCLFIQLLLPCSFPRASSRVGCVWEQAEFTLLALDDAILPPAKRWRRIALHVDLMALGREQGRVLSLRGECGPLQTGASHPARSTKLRGEVAGE